MRMMLIAGSALMIATVAMAQDTKEFDLKVTGVEVGIIGEALQELAYKKAAPLLIKLQSQVNEQLKPKDEVKPEDKK